MGSILTWAAVAVVFAGVMAGLAWLGVRVRRRGSGASAGFVGPFEDMWHPAARRARFETQVVEERVLPRPTPDDAPPRG